MGVGDDELDARETARRERAQEGEPEGAVLRRTRIQAKDLPLAMGVHSGGDDHGDVHHTPALAHALRARVEPDVRVGTGIERARAEGLHLLVEQ